MRVWPLMLAVVVGCGFEHGLQPVDTPPDMTQPADEDGDGVDDADDNCVAIANVDQRDHDADGRGDLCDLCPHIATATDADGDKDGVGDSCDPRPSIGTDRRVLWEGFYAANAIDGWTQGGAITNWAVINGAVRQTESSAGDRVLILPTPYQKVYVATAFEILGLGGGATIGLCSGVAMPQFYCCTVRSAGPSVLSSSHIDAQSAQWTGSYNVGDRIQVVQDMSTTNRCDASQMGILNSRSSTVAGTIGQVQLYTASAGAAYDYVFIVEIGS